MSGRYKNINNVTEEELEEISLLQENCAKENQTEEDVKRAIKEWNKTEKGKETRKRAYDKSAKRLCYDPKKENFCTYATLRSRVKCHPDLYKDVNLLECVIK